MAKQTSNENIAYSSDKCLDLDTAATMFSLAFCDSHRALIRLTVAMNEDINIDNLQTALDSMIARFPSFFVRLSHNQFHYFFERLNSAPKILEEIEVVEPLCMTFDDLNLCAFRIVVKENCISMEYSHAVSDGRGGSVFLKSLIAEYLNIRYGISIPYYLGILDVKEGAKYNEVKDAYKEIAGSSCKLKDMSKAYSIKGSKSIKIHIMEISFKTDELMACAYKFDVTLTALLSGALTAALFDLQQKEKGKQHEIRLSIPIDLRRHFSSATLRNFTLPTTVYAGKLKNRMQFSELCQSFDKQLKDNVDQEKLSALASSYVKIAGSKVVTALPLSFKKWAVQTFFATSRGGNCMTFSNLGIWSLPDNLKPYIKKCSMAFSPKPLTPYSCGVVSVNNVLTITLTRNIKEPLLEPRVIQILINILLNKNTRLEQTTKK